MSIFVEMPSPPSMDRLYSSIVRGGKLVRIKSREYVKWMSQYDVACAMESIVRQYNEARWDKETILRATIWLKKGIFNKGNGKIKKYDACNLEKAVFDTMQKYLPTLFDDCQIVDIRIVKCDTQEKKISLHMEEVSRELYSR